jgi:hypothetical protein
MPTCCWANLTRVSGGEKTYLQSATIIINCPARSAAFGGQDGMDASGAYWMTFPFWEAFQMRQILMVFVDFWYLWNSVVSSYPITTRV